MAHSNVAPVAFPSSDPSPPHHVTQDVPVPSPQRRQHLLSFRRISTPAAPALVNKPSSASIMSHASREVDGAASPSVAPASDLSPSQNSVAKLAQRPFALDPKPKSPKSPRKRRESTRPVDIARSVKRSKIIYEFYDTERAYVDGLDLIYSHFLTPLIESLDTPLPLLGREELMSVFSNFIDIWNLHRSIFSSLTDILAPSLQTRTDPPSLAPVLISHFPYLSLYTPFITSFTEVMAKLIELETSNERFGEFVREKEAHPKCARLKLRDWMLTIVQRCPRYLLLLKDLIGCTELDDPEYPSLTAAHSQLSKVTSSLDTSVHSHAQTLELLALQRNTYNLPIQFVAPGRTLLRRGCLMQLDNSSILKEREFLLFSDCLVWLANDRMIEAEWLRKNDDSEINSSSNIRKGIPGKRPAFKRTRSKSENEVQDMPRHRNRQAPPSAFKGGSCLVSGLEERWWYKGKVDLVDAEIVLSATRERGDERRFDILDPAMSFSLYADCESQRDEWVTDLRGAKATLMISLNVMHPNSTLNSSSSRNHIRRSLQAIPYHPLNEENQTQPRRGKVDHFVPAVWVPDGKTSSCMRCGRLFSWRRRRHHCRLCGRCICANCSNRTFFISDSSAKDPSKSARACNACYDTVFPLIEASASEGTVKGSQSSSTMTSFPSWKTQKPVPRDVFKPSSLMALQPHAGSPSRMEVIKRPQTRPLSHPVIPQVFVDPEAAEEGELNIGSFAASSFDSSDDVKPRPTLRPSPRITNDPSGSALSVQSSKLGVGELSDFDAVSLRARKRFSMPALALQTTPVTALPKVSGEGRSKRFSLVLGGRQKSQAAQAEVHEGLNNDVLNGGHDLRRGVAAVRLQELLKRKINNSP